MRTMSMKLRLIANEAEPRCQKHSWTKVFSYVSGKAHAVFIGLLFFFVASAAQAAPDVRITTYDWAPNPVLLGTPSTFLVRVTNLGTTSASAAQVTIAIPPNILVASTFPSYCTLSGSAGAQSLACTLPAIADSDDFTFTYNGVGRTIGSASGTATITAQGTGNSTISPTVIAAADMSITLTPSATTVAAGEIVTFTGIVSNAGPSSTSDVRAQFNIPASSDFTFQSAAGTGWTCLLSGTVVTCDYTGLAQTGTYPPIAIVGRIVKAIAGTISQNGSVSLTNPAIADPVASNNTTPNVVVNVSPGTDLAAVKSMPAIIVNGEASTISLRINNLGPQSSPPGARIVDTVPVGLTIGTMPPGCALAGRMITCTSGTIAAAGNQAFTIPVTGAALSVGTITNSATVFPPAGLLDPNPVNDTATADYRVVTPSSDLSIQKSKSPNPVAANGNITSSMTVRNNGPSQATYSPANPLRITDTLSADETFVSTVTPGWDCVVSGNVVTCETTGSGTISAPQTSPVVVPGGTTTLQIITRASASADGILSNTACTGTAGGSDHTPSDPNVANDCTSQGVRATTANADLEIIKDVSLSSAGPWTQGSLGSPLQVMPSDDSYFVRLRVRNNNAVGGDIARTINVIDTIPNYINQTVADGGSSILHRSTISVIGAVTNGSCDIPAIGPDVTCALIDVNPQEERVIILRVQRALISGAATNTASISSPDTAESNLSNNDSSAYLNVAPIADITVNSKTVNPNPARVGAALTYTLSIKNLGPNEAANVVLTDLIDTTRFELAAGSVSTTKPGVTSCDFVSGDRVTCDMGTFLLGQVFQTSFQVRARFPFAGSPPGVFPVSNSNTASVTTTTAEVVGGTTNNAFTLVHNVVAPAINLGVTKVEPSPAFDPIVFGDQLVYDVRVFNTGLSRATGIVVTDIPNPPSGFAMTFASFAVNPSGVTASSGGTLITPPAPDCVVVGPNVECRLHSSNPALSVLENNQQVVFRLFFDTAGSPSSGALTYSNSATVTAAEQTQLVTGEFDNDLANNTAVQTTFSLPKVDLEVLSKTLLTASPSDIGQPLTYAIKFRNNGPSPIVQVKILDQLPTGFRFVSATAVSDSGSAATIAGSPSCTSGATPTCTINGSFPPGAANTATLNLVAVPVNPYAGPLGVGVTNTATISPGVDGSGNPLGRDPISTNNSATADAVLNQSILSGRVYSDANGDSNPDVSEGVGSVTMTLRATSGVDANGTPFPDRVIQTNADGTFTFDRLPPGNFILIETQPTTLADAQETAGTAGGTPGATFTTSQISAIALPSATTATGYIFRELPLASVTGYVYRDTNNNGQRETGETGFAPSAFPSGPHVRLFGTDFSGVAVSLTASVNASGFYEFLNLRPSDASGYRLEQIVAPAGTIDGSEQNGAGVTVPTSGGRALAAEIIPLGVVAQGAALIERNFGEIQAASLSGVVWLDTSSDATRQAGETGRVPGATLRLTGTNDLGQAIDCLVNTNGLGAYSFGNAADANPLCQFIRPGTYQVQAIQIGGLSPIGAFIGSAGGTAGATTGTNQGVLGTQTISAITLVAGQSGTNYDFGGAGQGLSGSVYVDTNNNGTRDADEAGIPGVTITLSGTTSGAQSVCAIITCTAVTDASGAWRFATIPASDATGFTLTQQVQSSSPLSAFTDGIDRAGEIGGSTIGASGNDVITGIVMPTNGFGVNYNFGERGALISGTVFVDVGADGTLSSSDPGLAGVTITLSGTTTIGQNICTYLAALNPALSCVVVTKSDGSYAFPGLPAGTYDLVQTQPILYADGRDTAGTSGGNVSTTNGNTPAQSTISGINLTAGTQAINNNFGELGANISGAVYGDLDNSGTRSAGDTAIAGVMITLSGLTNAGTDVCVFLASQTPSRSCTTTTIAGAFNFTGLPAGNYTLTESQPAGYADGAETAGSGGGTTGDNVISGINLTTGGSATDNLFGETLSSISGVVYVDRDGSATATPGETPLQGVTIRLTGTDAQGQPVDLTTITGPDGRYSFPNLVGGNYTVTQTQPTAYGTATPNVVPVTLVGATPATVDFGEIDGGLSGAVYVDADRSGLRNGSELGLSGVTIVLSGTTLDGRDICAVLAGLVPDRSCTTTTGANGAYNFSRLPAGTYRVVETQPVGYADGPENAGTGGGTTSENTIAGITLTAGGSSADNNFGELIGGISGRVYVDANGNITPDPTERPVSGVLITLTGTDNQGRAVELTTTTDADGNYSFPNLVGGSYTITQTQPGAYGNGSPNVVGVTLPPGGAAIVNFAELAGGLSGAVYRDLNQDGTRQSGDTGIAGVTITLSGTTSEGADICTLINCTTTTEADGSYSFNGLPAGTYNVTETQPLGYADGAETAGLAGATTSDNVIRGLVLTGGSTAPNNLFGENLATITGTVYIDENADRSLTPGEVGIPSVTIRLTGTDVLGNPVDITTTTGPDGRYRFPNLLSGSYVVTQTQPDAFGSSTPNVLPISLLPGVTTTADFGELQRALAGTVFVDRDRDGLNDAGEGRLGGITVRLFNTAGILVGTTQTAADGSYRFEGLAPGAYTVEQVQPAGYGSSTPDRVAVTVGTLADSQVDFGETLIAVNGVVYDALARTPVQGAVVAIVGPAGFDPAIHLEGGATAGQILTGTDGLYAFRLLPGAPAGDYRFTVAPPATTYSPVWPSRLIVPCAQVLMVPTGVAITSVQTNGTPPVPSAPTSCSTGGQTTAYFTSVRLVPGSSSDVANNHLPIDPVLTGLLRVTKSTPQTLVTRGSLVVYTISVINAGAFAVPNVEVIDRLPAGFAYRTGTAQVDSVDSEPQVRAGREMVWGGLTVPAGQTRSISFVLAVGANVPEGDHVNQALAGITGSAAQVSNVGEATVRLMPDVDFDCTDVIGKVYDDRNGNGRQDEGELGLAGVRVATPNGLLITTDSEGRYHIVCIVIPNAERGSNVAIKLDVRTLPTGYRITTENPEVVRATRGRVVRVNFGAAMMQVVRIDMDAAAFTDASLSPALDQALLDLVPTLEAKPSVVRLAYTLRAGETRQMAQDRVRAAARRLEDIWDDKPDRCRLIVETEVLSGAVQ
jgi:large repetitive protein